MIVASDFDGTLLLGTRPNATIAELLRRNIDAGNKPLILTARNADHDDRDWRDEHEPGRVLVPELLDELGLSIPVVYLNHLPKWRIMPELRAAWLWDNDEREIIGCHRAGLAAITSCEALELFDRSTRCKRCGNDPRLTGVYRTSAAIECAICRYQLETTRKTDKY